MMSEKVIIIGATSGIGRQMAIEYLREGAHVGISGRRLDKLEEIRLTAPDQVTLRQMDITDYKDSREKLLAIINEMGGVDVLVVNSGVGYVVADLEAEIRTIETNATGFVNLMRTGLDYMKNNHGGKLVGISSVSAARGFRIFTVYGATKRFISHYMEGLRHFIATKKLPVKIIDIRAGYIETPIIEGNNEVFWLTPLDKGVRLIMKAIKRGHAVAYIPGKWKIVFTIFRILPRWLSYKL